MTTTSIEQTTELLLLEGVSRVEYHPDILYLKTATKYMYSRSWRGSRNAMRKKKMKKAVLGKEFHPSIYIGDTQ